MSYRILTDEDVRRSLPMSYAIEQMETAFREKAASTLISPPRFSVDAPGGSLVFTAGAATGEQKVIGFRAYHTYPLTSVDVEDDQIVAVYDSEHGALKGLIIGRLLGAMRTGAINGVAARYMARQDARSLAVIGAGYHARFQVAAAMAVRPIDTIYVTSRTFESAASFAAELSAAYAVPVHTMNSAQEAVAGADIVICATNSRRPVLESGWLRPGTHINAIGPKFRAAHELPPDIAAISAVIATDSLAQVKGSAQPFFLPDISSMVEMDQIVVGHVAGRPRAEDITLFCSVGLAGTEVILANALFEQQGRES